ncbi:MAG TPA: DUF2267 domain-containing protein [Rugosimonospora sp.]|jgi:uncharacterized protein (DUF2267 family)
MTYDEFVDAVAIRAGMSPAEAEVLTHAALQTLADRLTAGEARDLGAQLPRGLQESLQPRYEKAEAFGLEEFVRRVGNRAGVDMSMAWHGMRAVLATLRGGVSAGEFQDVIGQLPKEYLEALQPAR